MVISSTLVVALLVVVALMLVGLISYVIGRDVYVYSQFKTCKKLQEPTEDKQPANWPFPTTKP